MSEKIQNKLFKVNQDIIPDSLVFMLHAYFSGNYEKFSFWKRQFDMATKVEDSEDNKEQII